MGAFEDNYRALNDAQRQAVDHIDGPLLVLAGPGTGKTQLLSMRVANILRQTDVNPNNILCLTFTESGAAAMRERLIGIMGQDAYNVAIHTFHSFGVEVVNTHAEYFYHGANFHPADELSTYEILGGLFEKLPLSSPIASTMNGDFTYLRDTQRAIGDLKKSGLLHDELLRILDHNDAFIEFAEPKVQPLLAARFGKSSPAEFAKIAGEIADYPVESVGISTYQPLSELFSAELDAAIADADATGKTGPLTAWRNIWFEKDTRGEFVFKDRRRNQKLRAVASIYYDYMLQMQERSLYDFDDMILRVLNALELFPDLRYDLQEQYQYILVDEFQDTNGGQLRLLFSLINSEHNEGRPNVMVVGDDDQAIYSFQGADLSNISQFKEAFPATEQITLTENYRSDDAILAASRSVAAQISSRVVPDKKLNAHHKTKQPIAELAELPTAASEFYWVTKQIKERLTAGQKPQQMAVIARGHAQLLAFLPYMHHAGVPVAYERRDNVLESPPVKALIMIAEIIDAQARHDHAFVNGKLPELLAHPAWNISPDKLWRLSLAADEGREKWLETMSGWEDTFAEIAGWIKNLASAALHEPLELILDQLFGADAEQVDEYETAEVVDPSEVAPPAFVSPFKNYYFADEKLETKADSYIAYLEALTTLRKRLREYAPDRQLRLADFVEFIRLHDATRLGILTQTSHTESEAAVKLMTAHKAKGLEFDTVFVLNGQDNIWGNSAHSRSRLISFPNNLPITPAGEREDERIRLLYVAMTRARNELIVSMHKEADNGRESLPVKFLQIDTLPQKRYALDLTSEQAVAAAEATWHDGLTVVSPTDMRTLLGGRLEGYQLNPTHLKNFLDVTRGGPRTFLLQNLLRFPQAMQPSAMFGSAIHRTLQRAHNALAANGERRPLEDVLQDFEEELTGCRLGQNDYDKYLEKGTRVLTEFLGQRYDSFDTAQKTEISFKNQGAVVDGVHLTGELDLMQIKAESKEVIVTDYKTGKPASSWQGKTDYEKIKLHQYRQQLILYKLLVEHSRDYGKYVVSEAALEFVEPDTQSAIQRLVIDFDPDEIERFRLLLQAVWRHVQDLDFPDTNSYEQNYKGIIAFEADLIDLDSKK